MCEFCLKHGDGRTWYLQAENYSADLLSDLRRRRFIVDFATAPERLPEGMERLARLERLPRVLRRLASWAITKRFKRLHFGQVVPIEDVERILNLTNSVVRVPCICRYATRHVDAPYCYAVSVTPGGGLLGDLLSQVDGSYLNGPDATGPETVTREDALASMRDHEREGLCHTVWTFRTPFIGGICNCDRADCLAMRSTLGHDVSLLFRAEYVAEVDAGRCTGCRACMRVCQFGAIGTSAARQKVGIDPKRCYGCGACRAACPAEAISLRDRREVPAAKNLW